MPSKLGGGDETGKARKPEIEPQRREDDKDEIDQRRHKTQRLRRAHAVDMQVQPGRRQAGLDQRAEVAARIGNVETLRQPLIELPQHPQFENDERNGGRQQGRDCEMAMPDTLDIFRHDAIADK